MALQLPMTDRFGNAYPNGYRRLAWMSKDFESKTCVYIFKNYPTRASRNSNPGLFFEKQTRREITREAKPEKRSPDGLTVVESALPSFDDFETANALKKEEVRAYDLERLQVDAIGAIDV